MQLLRLCASEPQNLAQAGRFPTPRAELERPVTIGELSRRTAMPVRVLREYADMGLIYTVGRSPGNYRLFDESALWCVEVIHGLRSLGLTIAEIRDLASVYLARTDEPIGPHLAERLAAARARIEARIGELQRLRRHLDEFEAAHTAELAGKAGADFRASDPRSSSALDSHPGRRL